VRAQPIFLYPATWLAKNAARMEQEDEHALKGFQGVNNLLRRIEALLAFDATPRLGALRLPVLLAAARDDVLVPSTQSEHLATLLADAKLHVAPWGGHGMNVTDPDSFNAVLLEFLSTCRPAGSAH
jgi:aminoacrylate hydrolase